jgi:hypothetical protein
MSSHRYVQRLYCHLSACYNSPVAIIRQVLTNGFHLLVIQGVSGVSVHRIARTGLITPSNQL